MGRPISFATFRATQLADAADGGGWIVVRWELTEKGRAALAGGDPRRCAWCGRPIQPGQRSTPLGVAALEAHNDRCLSDITEAIGAKEAE